MRLVACIGAAVVLLAAAGCSGSVTGEVSSKTAQKPVPAATVKVGDQTVITDTSGRFSVEKVSTGSQRVAVNAEGYGPYTQSLEVQKGDNTLNVALEDGTVTGALRENAVIKKAVKDAQVTVAGKKAVLEGAKFVLAGVPVGSQTLKVVAPGHETYAQEITVAPGQNEAEVELNLTAVETYARMYQAIQFRHYRDAYQVVHPDIRRRYSFNAYVKDDKASYPVLSMKVFGTKVLSKWKPSFLDKTYRHVVAIDRAVRWQDSWGSRTTNDTRHVVNIDGRWYLIYDWRD